MALGSGGYVSTSRCTTCDGDNVYKYSCYCCASDVCAWASIDLSRLISLFNGGIAILTPEIDN